MKTPSMPGFYELHCYTINKNSIKLHGVSIFESIQEAIAQGKKFLKEHKKAFFYKLFLNDFEIGSEMSKKEDLLN